VRNTAGETIFKWELLLSTKLLKGLILPAKCIYSYFYSFVATNEVFLPRTNTDKDFNEKVFRAS
jgi:hypothetical protein